MTYGAFTSDDFPAVERRGRSRGGIPQSALCALALLASTSIGLWALYGHGGAVSPIVVALQTPVASATIALAASPAERAAPMSPQGAGLPLTGLRRDAALLRRTITPDDRATIFPQRETPRSTFEQPPQHVFAAITPDQLHVPALIQTPAPPVVAALEESVPMPTPRPSDLTAPKVAPLPHADATRIADGPRPVAPDVVPADHRSFFDRLFRPTSPARTALAYAAPDDGGLGRPDVLGRSLPYDRWTAVYVISTHTVYLPDGTKLEAHSGLGASHDNPSSVAERMRGVTPPNVYDLQLREAPFHGVRALRLNPVDGNAVYGRAGLLAHTYMLGPRGDSNGCVVFRNYPAFLNAYDSGAIRRLAVVARLD